MNTESKQIWIGRPHLVLGKDVARAVADVGLNGHKELWFEVPADRKDDLVTERADAFVLMLLRQALLTGAHIFSEAPAEAVIKANREKLLEKAKETGLL